MKIVRTSYGCDKCGALISSDGERIAHRDIPFDWRTIETYVQRSIGVETQLLLCPKCNSDFENAYIPLDERAPQ